MRVLIMQHASIRIHSLEACPRRSCPPQVQVRLMSPPRLSGCPEWSGPPGIWKGSGEEWLFLRADPTGRFPGSPAAEAGTLPRDWGDLGEWGEEGEATGPSHPPVQGKLLRQIQAFAEVFLLGIEGFQLGGAGPVLLPLMLPGRMFLKKIWLKSNETTSQ